MESERLGFSVFNFPFSTFNFQFHNLYDEARCPT